VQRARRRSLDDGIDDDERVEVRPLVQKTRGLVRALEYVRTCLAEPLGDERPDRVVAAERAPEADCCRPQSRSTSSRRKCVAHEMHGS